MPLNCTDVTGYVSGFPLYCGIEIQGLSSTCPVFKYFQSREFRGEKIQVLSRTFEDAWEP